MTAQRHRWTGLLLGVLGALTPAVAWTSPAEGVTAAHRAGELLVKYASATDATSTHPATQRLGATGRWVHLRLAAGQSVEGMARWYRAQPGVAYAEPNYLVQRATLPNDPDFPQQWALRNTGQSVLGRIGTAGADIGAATAWQRHTGSGAVLVAVADSGIVYDHPDLATNLWRNPGEVPGNGRDDDGNGYVDDLYGWDFANRDADPMDDDPYGHGTAVAGIIGAVGDNALGVSGVNWRVRLMALKVLRADGSGDVAGIIAAFEYARAMGVRVLNASYSYGCGASPSLAEREALERLREAGILVVFPAGNEGCDNDRTPTYPASHPLANLLAVGGSDSNDALARFGNGRSSSYGAHTVHLFAPAVNVLTTVRNGYAYVTGTSAAAPHVAGAAALLMSHRPGLSMPQVREILLKSAARRPQLAGLAVTGGRLDLGRAMDYALAAATPMQPSHLKAVRVHAAQVDLSWLDDSTIEQGWFMEHRTDPAEPWRRIDTLPAQSQAYAHRSVDAGEASYNAYRIVAFNAVGESDPSAEVRIVVPPLAPDRLSVRAESGGVRLTWQDRSRREHGYRLERATDTGGFIEIASLPADATDYLDTSIVPGTSYRYRVRAYHAITGYSDFSNTASWPVPGSSGGGGGGCFIATAAYGSALHPRVQALRALRDRYLLPYAWGRALVRVYYRLSPPIAARIARHDSLRAITRALLTPVVWAAEGLVGPAAAAGWIAPRADTAQARPDALLVRFHDEVTAARAQQVLRAQGLTEFHTLRPGLYLVPIPKGADAAALLARLQRLPEVRYAEPNRRVGRVEGRALPQE
ncbi:MAG: S8 family serine peptidase [Burkholderiales bacterium]|nr:S8 family serine peptidase [Burkholderiales bacterium]